MRIVITGATGYIGSKLTCRLKQEGHEICAVVRKSSNIETLGETVKFILDGGRIEELYNGLAEFKPETFINLAGFYCGNHNEKQIAPLIEGNIMLPTYVADAAIQAGSCKYILHTASVQQNYDGKDFCPINLYSATKQAFEDVLFYYTTTGKVSAITLQLFDTYGADDRRRKVINLVRMLKDGQTIEMSPGKQKMYLCYIDDVIEAYREALRKVKTTKPGFNAKYAVRGEEPITLKDFVNHYLEKTSRPITVIWGGRSYMEKEIMNPTGYGNVLPGWQPQITYEQGIWKCAQYDLAQVEK